jgi:predicted anti-sigma-YlaC factor YlaD
MTCQQLVELVTDYLEGRLTGADLERFEGHLGECPPCGVYLDQMRLTLQSLGRIPVETIAPEARTELLHAFAELRT